MGLYAACLIHSEAFHLCSNWPILKESGCVNKGDMQVGKLDFFLPLTDDVVHSYTPSLSSKNLQFNPSGCV